MATAPKTWVEWADFFSKSLIATAGLVVSVATLVLGQAEKGRAQAEQRQATAEKTLADNRSDILKATAQRQALDDSERTGILAILAQLSPDDRQRIALPALSDYCNNPAETASRTGMNASLCRNVARYGSVQLATNVSIVTQVAQTAVGRQNAKAFLNSPVAAAQNAGVAAAEAARPAASDRWFAVVGTLPQSAPGAVDGLARQLNARLLGAGLPPNDVHVYRTRISNSFALTSGTDKSEDQARDRARMLRRAGFTDAFAQPDRGWTKADDLR